jgi:hypothetical protein
MRCSFTCRLNPMLYRHCVGKLRPIHAKHRSRHAAFPTPAELHFRLRDRRRTRLGSGSRFRWLIRRLQVCRYKMKGWGQGRRETDGRGGGGARRTSGSRTRPLQHDHDYLHLKGRRIRGRRIGGHISVLQRFSCTPSRHRALKVFNIPDAATQPRASQSVQPAVAVRHGNLGIRCGCCGCWLSGLSVLVDGDEERVRELLVKIPAAMDVTRGHDAVRRVHAHRPKRWSRYGRNCCLRMFCLFNLYIARKYRPSMTNPVTRSINSKDARGRAGGCNCNRTNTQTAEGAQKQQPRPRTFQVKPETRKKMRGVATGVGAVMVVGERLWLCVWHLPVSSQEPEKQPQHARSLERPFV